MTGGVPGIIRVTKWCPGCKTEYEGNTWAGAPPIPSLLPIRDTEGRVIGFCGPCINKEQDHLKRLETAERRRQVTEISRPERTRSDLDDD